MNGLFSQNIGMQQSPFGNNLPNSTDGSNVFAPIRGDADFMSRMSAGEFDNMQNDPEMNRGVMEYLNAPASAITAQQIGQQGMRSAEDLGMSAYKDMSQANQATPLAGLMGMATAGQRPQQYRPYPVQQGLMNPWGG